MLDHPHQEIFTPHLFLRVMREQARRPLLYAEQGATWTGEGLEQSVSRYFQLFKSLGVGRKSSVALLSTNRPEVLFVDIALSFLGALFVPLHPRGAVADFEYVIRDAGVTHLVFDPVPFGASIAELQKKSPHGISFLSLGPWAGAIDLMEAAQSHLPERLHPPVVQGDDVMRLAYSGGTTGTPKAIQLTYRTIAATVSIMTSEWQWPSPPTQLLCAPLSHSGALCCLPTLLRGGSIRLLPGFDPVRVMETIERYRINCILLIPTMIYALLDHPKLSAYDLGSLETIFYGASPMSLVRLKEAMQRFGRIFFQFYGQSEAPMTVCVLRKEEHVVDDDARLSSCGRPVAWLHVEVLDPDGQQVGLGLPGEICVRGPIVMRGYLNKPQQTEEAFAHGWLRTGDIAIADAEGFLRIVDRSKDMIITGGFNVYAREVEHALELHPAVSVAGVFADSRWGEAVSAAVVLRQDMLASAEELIAHVRGLKGPVHAPKRLVFMESMPLTALGKPNKKLLREMVSTDSGVSDA
jgi:fatty-acyl-CoA synthase